MTRAARAALVGYAAGLATAAVIILLVKEAAPGVGKATPTPRPQASSSVPATALLPPSAGTEAIPLHTAAPLSPEARSRIAPLEERLAADSSDLAARKQLAVVLLRNRQLMLAYEHASEILEAHPDDPDGLYVHGVVRLAMGHASRAIELLDRVLARYPDHALALDARAEAQRKIGDESGAAITAARARQAARGGGNAEAEGLLTAASDGTLFEMLRGSEPAAPAAGGGGSGGTGE